jgi:hypothetical protein
VRTVRTAEKHRRPFVCPAQLHLSEEGIRLLARQARFRRLGPCFNVGCVEALDLVALVAQNRGECVWSGCCLERQRPLVYKTVNFFFSDGCIGWLAGYLCRGGLDLLVFSAPQISHGIFGTLGAALSSMFPQSVQNKREPDRDVLQAARGEVGRDARQAGGRWEDVGIYEPISGLGVPRRRLGTDWNGVVRP